MIYLDAAASSLKPNAVIKAETSFLKNNYANAGRGTCVRADWIDTIVNNTRKNVADFIGAENPNQIIFTSGATDGMNRIAQMLDREILNPDSVIVVSDLDHHSSRLPFEDLAKRGRCKIWVCPLTAEFEMDADALKERCAKGDVVAVVISAMSNVLGMPIDVEKLVKATKLKNSNPITIIDAAQAVAHISIDVKKSGADALVFSGHKIGANTGIGILYLKTPDKWSPSDFGGGMVTSVAKKDTDQTSDWKLTDGPAGFEAGTLPLTQIAGLGPAIQEKIKNKNKKEKKLLNFLYKELSSNPRVHLITNKDAYVISFTVKGMHPIDFGAYAGACDVCLRVGNMCASWLHKALGLDGSIRISVGPWNTMDEMKKLMTIINKILERKK